MSKGNSCRKLQPEKSGRETQVNVFVINWRSIKPVSKNRPKNIDGHYEILVYL